MQVECAPKANSKRKKNIYFKVALRDRKMRGELRNLITFHKNPIISVRTTCYSQGMPFVEVKVCGNLKNKNEENLRVTEETFEQFYTTSSFFFSC